MPELLTSEDPERIAGYWLAARLGAGGQGTVYEAYDHAGTRVAVKVLRPELVSRPEIAGRFAKEVLAAQRVESFCTARVIEAGTDGERPYIVSEFVAGRDLRKAVRESGPLTGDALVRLATGVATALAAIHRAEVVHRDLKPDNILLGTDGPRVIDFGIARTNDMSLTATGHLMGTPGYMGPEVLTGHRASAAADVFAWGAVMVFAATGRDPFHGENLGEIVVRVTEHEPDLAPLPAGLRALVGRALSKSPDERPSSTELLLALLGGPERADASLLVDGRQSAGALRDTAEDGAEPGRGAAAAQMYQGLPLPVQQAVRQIVLRLVVPGTAPDGSQDTTRTASTSEWFDGLPYEERGALRLALDSLVTARLLVLEADTVRLAGLGLIRAWPQLRAWVDQDRDALGLLRWLTQAAGYWDGHGRTPDALPTGGAPQAARACVADAPPWLRASRLEAELLEAHGAAAAHARRRTRRLRAGGAALLALALVAGLVAWQQKRIGDERGREASARDIASIADSLRTSDPETAALLSVAAWRVAPVGEARAALYGALGQDERKVATNPAGVSTGVYEEHIDTLLDGRTLAVLNEKKSMEVWDLVTGKRTARAELSQEDELPAAPDPTGTVAVQPKRKGVQLIDLVSGKPGRLILEDQGALQLAGMSEKAGLLLVTSYEARQETLLVDGATGRIVLRIPGRDAVALSRDGATLAYCLPGRPVQLYTVATGQTAQLTNPDPYPTTPCGKEHGLRFSGNGKRLIHMNGPNSTLWDLPSRKSVYEFSAKSVGAVNEDASLMAEVTDTQVKMWSDRSSSSAQPLLTFPRPEADGAATGVALAFDADGRRLLSLSRDRQVRYLDLTFGLEDAASTVNVMDAVFAPDARTLVTAGVLGTGRDAEAKIRTTADGRDRALPEVPLRGSTGDADLTDDDGGAVYSRDGRLLAGVVGDNGKLRVMVWDVREGRKRAEISLPKSVFRVDGVEFTPDGKQIVLALPAGATPNEPRTVQVWDVASGKRAYEIKDAGAANLAVNRDGTLLFTSAGERIDLATRKVERGVFGPGVIQDLEFSDDGSVLAVSLLQGAVTLWDGSGRRRLGALSSTAGTRGEDFGGRLAGLRFSHDGRTLAAMVGESRVQLWDVPTRRRLGDPMRGSAGFLRAVAFDSAGRLHVSSSFHPHRVFDLGPANVAKELCRRVGRDLTRAQWEQNVPDLPYRSVC
ncbi:protein kinase [Streptomyces goshikiensis]|uniref:protein kinase domain-containing protein n=1 Tax=Streptomyces goshikiensis TaxID=1942 RepID=UPI00378B9898